MWKKDDPLAPGQNPSPSQSPTPPGQTHRPTGGSGERATIGRSITIKGEVSGDEDLLIQGRIDGSVELKQQSVTVGQEGRVNANISGRVIVVEGEVHGDLRAQEQIILRSTADVEGDITAARVVLEDGARFRGGVEMGDTANPPKATPTSSSSFSKKGQEATKGNPEGNKDDSGKTEKPGAADKATS